MVHGLPVQEVAQHRHDLVGAGVAVIVCQLVPVGALFGRIAARHHVQCEPAAREPPEGVGLLGDQRGTGEPGAERHEEADPGGVLRERGRQDPGVDAAESHRGQQRVETGLFGSPCDLGEVRDVGGPTRGSPAAPLDGGDAAGVAAVPAGGQEPVEQERVLGHGETSSEQRGAHHRAAEPAGGTCTRGCGRGGGSPCDRRHGRNPAKRPGPEPRRRARTRPYGVRDGGSKRSTAVRTGGDGPTEHGRHAQQIYVTTRYEYGGHGVHPVGVRGVSTSRVRIVDEIVPDAGRAEGAG